MNTMSNDPPTPHARLQRLSIGASFERPLRVIFACFMLIFECWPTSDDIRARLRGSSAVALVFSPHCFNPSRPAL